MIRPKQLSAAFVKTVTRPGRYGDGIGGHGLSLLVKPTTTGRLSKTWSQRLQVEGNAVNMGLGSYPVVTLAHARKKALANRRSVAQGSDPRGSGVPTFAEAAEKVIAIHRESWRPGSKSEAQWRASLRDYALPRLESKPVDQVTTSDVLAVLVPIWSGKRETARRVRQRIGAVMKWAVAEGYREDNPAGDAIGAALPRHRSLTQHFPALPHKKVAGAMAMVRVSGAWTGTKLAFEFLVLTAARSGEVREARWEEIDFESGTWRVPGERMKSGHPHRVPLSRRALAVLVEARGITDGRGLVFPAVNGRSLSAMTLTKLVRELGIEAVPHGFRSSFRDWAAEETDHPHDVIEAALAHVIRNKVEAAYMRTDLFERRRHLMEDWATYVAAEASRS